MSSQIILLTTFPARLKTFPDHLQRLRAEEFEQCLANNCATDIDRVIVFFEGDESGMEKFSSLSHAKVEVIFIDERPSLSLFFNYANKHLAGHFIVISNADVYFDPHTPVHRIREVKSGCLWALCRYMRDSETPGGWKLENDGLCRSYDSYIFRAPLKEFECDYPISTHGSDCLVVQKAGEALIKVSNPCLTLIIKHLDMPYYEKWQQAPDEEKYQKTHSCVNHPDYSDFSLWQGSLFWFFDTYVYPRPAHIEDGSYSLSKAMICRFVLAYQKYFPVRFGFRMCWWLRYHTIPMFRKCFRWE